MGTYCNIINHEKTNIKIKSNASDFNSRNLIFLYSSVVSTILDLVKIKGFDVKALRAFRVLRPLRLVSGVPSK